MKSKLFSKILNAVNDLSHSQRVVLQSELNHLDSKTLVCDFFEKRLENNRICLHCGSSTVIKNGFSAGLTRYRCKDCGRSFNALTGTPFARLRKKELWLDYAECLISSFSVRKIAKKLNINHKTAFYWRHRFLSTAHSNEPKTLIGIIEADDTFFRKSMKGSKKLKRAPRKRGEPAKKRGLSKEYVSVLVACDRNGREADYITGVGSVSKEWLERVFTPHIGHDSLLITDKAHAFKFFCEDKKITHKAVSSKPGERVNGIYHIQHVNAYHSRLKMWMKRFHGVATKYLNNYLGWCHEISARKLEQPIDALTLAFPLKTHCSGT